jgi:paraquat-inducible protein B
MAYNTNRKTVPLWSFINIHNEVIVSFKFASGVSLNLALSGIEVKVEVLT